MFMVVLSIVSLCSMVVLSIVPLCSSGFSLSKRSKSPTPESTKHVIHIYRQTWSTSWETNESLCDCTWVCHLKEDASDFCLNENCLLRVVFFPKMQATFTTSPNTLEYMSGWKHYTAVETISVIPSTTNELCLDIPPFVHLFVYFLSIDGGTFITTSQDLTWIVD